MGFTSKTLKGDHNLYMFELDVNTANSLTGGTGNTITYDDGTHDELITYHTDDADLRFVIYQNTSTERFWLRVTPSSRCNIVSRCDKTEDFDMTDGSYGWYTDETGSNVNHGRLSGNDYVSIVHAGKAKSITKAVVTVTPDQGSKFYMYTFEVTSAPLDGDQVMIGIRQTAGNATT